MLNVKNGKVNNINDVLEEIVRCVTAPSFCVMPWKCVTMAVGDRTDPLVKKSVVHIYRASMNGQNIFQIKVHNCKKELCDHAICTKDCETTRPANTQEGKEAMLNETHKRRRKKRNNFSDGNKEMLSCCQVNNTFDELEKNTILKEHQRSKRRNPITHKNKRKTKNLENKEKPSCTLQIFAEGKTRKLNFQLHPAMKVFLGRALDRIEGHDSKRSRTNSPSYRMDPCDEFLRETTDGYKSKSAKKHSRKSQSSKKNRRTESVEEFEINLPDNTCLPVDNLDDLYKNHLLTEGSNNISKGVCHWDLNQIPCDTENNRTSSGLKINGYLLDNIVPTQQSHNGRGKPRNETDSQIGRAPEKSYNDLLMTDNTYQKTSPVFTNSVPIPESYYERGIRHNRNEGKPVADEEQFQFPDRYQRSFQGHQDRGCNYKHGVKSNEKQNPTDSSRNIFSGNENNPHSYSNPSPSFQNRPRDNIIRTPYVIDNCTDNNEHIANDIRQINNRNYSISDNRASVYSTEYLNGPPIYRNNAAIFSPPISHETYPMATEYGPFLTNAGVYSNGFYGTRQYHDFSHHERECLNIRVPPLPHHQMPHNQHDIIFPKKYIDRETQISQEGCGNEKEPRYGYYRSSNNIGTNAFPESNRKYVRETNKLYHGMEDLEDVPTSDRSHNYGKNNVRNVYDHEDNDVDEKRTFDYLRNVSPGETEIAPEIKTDHRTKKKNRKESEKTSTNNDNRKPENSTSAHDLPSCSKAIESNTPNNQNVNKTQNIDKKSSYSSERKYDKLFARKDKKDRNEKYFVDKPYFHQYNNEMFKNANPTAHSKYKFVNNPRTMYKNEDEHFLQQRDFKQTKPSNITSDDKIRNRLKINKRKVKKGNSNASQTNALHREKTSKKPHSTIKRTQSMETTDSSNHFAEDVNVNDASEKSSDILPFLYHFPEGYSNYQLFKHNQSKNGKEAHSREKIDSTNEDLCDEEYNSKFFCFPSQISWDHYESLQHIIPNINHYLKVNNARSGRRFEPKQKIVSDNESSKLCEACCKVLKEEKPGEKSKGVSRESKHESRDLCSENIKENNSQYKVTTNLEESNRSKNENLHKKGLLLCDSKIINSNDEQKHLSCPLANDTTENNQICLNKNDDRRDLKGNIIDNKPKEQNATVKNENIQKWESKMLLHSQSVKKFFNHAKEYLNFRKNSTISIKSGFSNSVLQIGQSNSQSASQSGGVVNTRVDDNPIFISNQSVKVSSCKRNYDDSNLNKKQCSKPDNRANSENNIDVSQSENVQGDLCIKLKPTDTFGNNTSFTRTYQKTKLFKPQTHTSSQRNLKDEKYRLYGSNEPTIGRPSMEDSNKKIIKNEFRILETESECEGFSEEMYSYSSNCSQSEVAKNWVATTRKKYIKHHKRATVYKKTSSMSVYSSGSNFSNCEVRKEDKCENGNKNSMINATIALSSDNKKERNEKLKIEGPYQTIKYTKEKSDHKFSDIFSNSIKNNFKKIKGLVKRNHTRHKSKSPKRKQAPKSSSYTETQSHSALTPVTSTYTSTKSGETTSVTENTKTNDKFCNHSATNNYLSDTDNAKSDPIIRKIEPDTWQKFLSKGFSLQSEEINDADDAENMETENSSISDNSIEEINLKERSHHRILQPFITTRDSINTPTLSKTHSSMGGPTGQRRGYDSYQSNHLVPSETMDEKNQSDETILASSCFENPMVDPKTGFRPIFPI